MFTIEKSKEILNRDGLNYTDEEVKKIREFIYILAEIDYRLWERKRQEKAEQFQKGTNEKFENENRKQEQETKIININLRKKYKKKNNKLKLPTNETKSHSIHPREYGRAG